MHKNPLPLLVSVAVALAALLPARAQQTYFNRQEMPDLIKCLPAPPDTVGPDFAHDILRYMWGKTQRLDSVRAAIAEGDAVWSRSAAPPARGAVPPPAPTPISAPIPSDVAPCHHPYPPPRPV